MSYKETREGKYTVLTYPNGTKHWLYNELLHREDGPAVERSDRHNEWFLNGKHHREDGPALEDADGTKVWILNGEKHREDGPAYEGSDGTKIWWLNDIVVYSDYTNNLKDYPDVSEAFKRSIIKYELQRS